MNKVIQEQMKYILNELKTLSLCQVSDKYSRELNKVSIPLVNEILQTRFTNGPDMKAVLCLFDTIIKSTLDKQNGLYNLPTSMQKWVTTMKKINVRSSEAKVYMSNVFGKVGVEVVIKSPKKTRDYEDLLREYYIGVTKVNELRYRVPNFMYTIGAFLYPEGKSTSAFIICEKIPGESLEDMLKGNKLSFSQFLALFVQILLALEVAQRHCRFGHFDLHAGNVIVRPIPCPFSYTIVLDNKRYDIVAHDYIPIIIDFGMSTVADGKRVVGSYYHSAHGMMNYLIQGADMYKLLFYCSLCSSGNLHRQILELFIFYGANDPYELLIRKPGTLKVISREFVKKISFSTCASHTPLEFANWILSRGSGVSTISISERDIYHPINHSSMIYDIFRTSDEGRSDALDIVLESSYILMEYTQGLISMCDAKLYTDNLRRKLGEMDNVMKKSRKALIRTDKKMLMEYENIEIPNKVKLCDYMTKILSIKIGYANKKVITKLITRFMNNVMIYKSLAPYLHFLFIIKELHLDERYKTYKKFVTTFSGSEQYVFYNQFCGPVEKTIRWCITLLET